MSSIKTPRTIANPFYSRRILTAFENTGEIKGSKSEDYRHNLISSDFMTGGSTLRVCISLSEYLNTCECSWIRNESLTYCCESLPM